MDLSQLSTEELQALLAQSRAQKKPAPSYNPTDDMSAWQTGLAGMGKAFVDPFRGIGQVAREGIEMFSPPHTGGRGVSFADKLGLPTREEIDAIQKRDAPLMDTGSGMAGNILGQLLPAILLPGSTIPKAAAAGAGMGFIQPVGTKDSRTENTALGATLNSAVPILGAAYKGARAVAEPVLAPQRTAARILEQFADDPQAMRLAAASAKDILPGSKTTLAQAVMQPGISTLERGAMNQAGPLQAGMTARMLEQNGARVAALDDLAGAGGKLDYFKQSRETVAKELYDRAFAESPADTSWIKGEVNKLMQRPAFVSALKDAQELALNSGIKVSPKNPENATQLLHFTKMSLDDQIEAAMRGGNGNKSRALIDTRDKLVSLMESKDFSPSYREARDTFKNMSKPINEMEIAGELRKKLVPALEADADKPAKLNANAFAADMQRRSGDIERVFSPEGKDKLNAVMQDIQRRFRAEGLGSAKGSPTAQNLTTQNLMRQIAGPLGLPESFMEKTGSALMATPGIGPAMQWAGKGMEQRVQRELSDLLLDPATASKAFALINQQSRAGRIAGQALPRLAGPLTATGLFANRN